MSKLKKTNILINKIIYEIFDHLAVSLDFRWLRQTIPPNPTTCVPTNPPYNPPCSEMTSLNDRDQSTTIKHTHTGPTLSK